MASKRGKFKKKTWELSSLNSGGIAVVTRWFYYENIRIHVLHSFKLFAIITEIEALSRWSMVVWLSQVHMLSYFYFNRFELMLLNKIIRCNLIAVPLDLIITDFHCIECLLPHDVALTVVFIMNSDFHSHFHVVNVFICVAVNHETVDLYVVLNGHVYNRLIIWSTNYFIIYNRFRKSKPGSNAIWSADTTNLIVEQYLRVFFENSLNLSLFVDNLTISEHHVLNICEIFNPSDDILN